MDGPSLLDTKIAEFFKSGYKHEFLDSLQKYFCNNNAYDWKEFGKLFSSELKIQFSTLEAFNSDFFVLKYSNFKAVVDRLYPIFLESSAVAQRIIKNSFYFEWLGENGHVLQKLIKESIIVSETLNVEQVLLLTSTLEYGLGNVYYSKTNHRNPPHLLRDLLCTKELFEVFGWEAICFLKILFGTPHSINLRNIVWHGFPRPEEISQHYVAVLIVVINTLGQALSRLNFKLKQRPQVTQLTRYLEKISSNLPQTDERHTEAICTALFQCDWLNSAYKTFWKQLFLYNEKRNWWQFVVLALPQIELLLRLIYAQANNYDVRAKLDEYYITMDTIFERRMPTDDKRLNMLLQPGYKSLNVNCLNLMYDLFAAPHGPRIRDKISHGEATVACIDNPMLCQILLYLSNELFRYHYQKQSSLTRYESLYHLNSLVYQSMNCAKYSLLSLHSEAPLKKPLLLGGDSCISIKIFQRPKNEAELMKILLKILQLLAETGVNYNDSVNERRRLLQQRELHSKRRRTFERMLEAMPEISRTLHLILATLEEIYRDLQEQDYASEFTIESVERLRRFLKLTLQIMENFLKYSFKESNEWIKALELCTKFQEHRKKYFS